MPHPQQRVISIKIKKLKGINNLEIDFVGKPLTAIMGVNGCGKTSILHALACCYRPYNGQGSRNYVFSEFFTPNTDSRWAGSELTLHYEHTLANPRYPTHRVYQKNGDRWSPRYDTRLQRWVSYIGVNEAVPIIEQLKTRTHIALTRTIKPDALSTRVRQAAGGILNINYTQYTENVSGKKVFIGVESKGTHYSAISMGSGEQRLFKILEHVYKAPDYGLILIDEIELLLHPKALRALIIKLHEIAEEKHLQIIFTTHSEELNHLKEYVNIRHIFKAEDGNNYCLKDTNPKLLYELTGNQLKPISIFVEDELSRQIIEKIASQLGIRQHIRYDTFGPATNCFTTAAGAVLNGINVNNTLFVIDGDLYTTKAKKKDTMNQIMSGTDFNSRRKKVTALSQITEFNLPTGIKPEELFHQQILATNPATIDAQYLEIRDAAVAINAVDDSHKYIDDIVERMGYSANDYKDIVSFLSTLAFWPVYVEPIYDWLISKKAELNI